MTYCCGHDNSWCSCCAIDQVDNCYGLLKSHVTCTNCGKESVTFDAFSSVSLPLPVRNTRGISVVAQLLPRGSQPVKLDLEVEVTSTMSELKKILVDALLEMRLIDIDAADGRDAVPPAPMDVEQSNSIAGSNSNSEGSFEMVNSEQTDSDFQMVESPKTPPPASEVATAAAATAKKSTTIYDSVHFHFGTLFSHRPASIFKHFNSSEAGGTSIQAYVGKMDSLIAFQLEQPAPEFRSSVYYSSYSRRVQYPESDDTAAYVAVDVCMGCKKVTTYGNYERIELQGYPHRIVVPKGCTNQRLHAAVWDVMRRFVADDSPYNCSNGNTSTDGAVIRADAPTPADADDEQKGATAFSIETPIIYMSLIAMEMI